MTPEQIAALTAEQEANLELDRIVMPEATASWRANYHFRMAYLRLATEQRWWHGSYEQVGEMRRLADTRFPDPTGSRGPGHDRRLPAALLRLRALHP